MKERLLSLNLESAIEAFQAIRWKFFHEDNERSLVKLEVPRGTGESYIVELHYEDQKEKDAIVDKLLDASFIPQSVRITSDW